jgi:hypothetical protein
VRDVTVAKILYVIGKMATIKLTENGNETVHVGEQAACDVINKEGETNGAGFHSCTVHIGTITVFYLPTDAQ